MFLVCASLVLALALLLGVLWPTFHEQSLHHDVLELDPHVGNWTWAYAAHRASYYLDDAKRLLDKAMRNYVRLQRGLHAPDPYFKIWDMQNQLSAALSWANQSADLWVEAGKMTFTLAGLQLAIADDSSFVQDALEMWAHALWLEAQNKDAALASNVSVRWRLKGWLRRLVRTPASALKRRLPDRFWLGVRHEMWESVRTLDHRLHEFRETPVTLRRMDRVSSLSLRSSEAVSRYWKSVEVAGVPRLKPSETSSFDDIQGSSGNWVAAKVGDNLRPIFPTYISRFSVLENVGLPLLEKLSELAIAKYVAFRAQLRKKFRRISDMEVNDKFNEFQVERTAEARASWPELYESREYRVFLEVARNASLAYLQHSGAQLTLEEVLHSTIDAWAAVYPQQVGTQVRHPWHVHHRAVVSGILYTLPRLTPLLLADPRGAPPMSVQGKVLDDEKGLMYEPKAPFDAPYQIFPERGEVVLFPSWLVHKVPDPFAGVGHGDGKGWRVAFPFNLYLNRRGGVSVWDSWERTVY